MEEAENIALFDMDGTLCDHDLALFEELEKMRNPSEEKVISLHAGRLPDYIKRRADVIRQQEGWWESMPKFQLGWDVLEIAKKEGFRIMILTQGPKDKPSGWSGKMKWLTKNLPGTDVTMTRDKGLVYGKMLVDDYPEYIRAWLKNRPRGLVIMPANDGNKEFKHPNVIRYTGKNLEEVKKAIKSIKERKARQELKL
ncbi:hypothetical protein KA107_01850 [Candidatus Pacearchaeota archaeon]|nr:hypothetical protein [Candidatus Pacearchaeota archaeon]